MGDCGLISKEEKSRVESITLKQTFEEQCPIYISYGMTYDEFWNKDPYRVKYYREAALLKLERTDEECWMQGVYVYDALCRVSPILHAFSKSGTKPLPYAEKPYVVNTDITKTKEEKKKDKKREKENAILAARVQFDHWMNATNKHFDKEKEG